MLPARGAKRMGKTRFPLVLCALLLVMAPREPLNNSLRTQRGLKRAAVESCLDGQGGFLS